MALPSVAEAEIYKSRLIQSQVRAAIQLDYPVYSGDFNEQFAGAALDTDLWFQFLPSWGLLTVGGGVLNIGAVGDAISPAWIQSRHNLAFPLRRDTDWTFTMRARNPVITGYGVFIRICGRSFRDAEAIWALHCNTADGLELHAPDGFIADNVIWSTVGGLAWRRYRVIYDASAQTYQIDIDQDDNGTWEWTRTIAVDGRYADAIVIGNSTAVQGLLGPWTEWEVDYIRIQGTAESVVYPHWASPFARDGSVFSYLPTLLGGDVQCSKDNTIDVARLTLDNFGLDSEGRQFGQFYSQDYFLNRLGYVEARAGDGNGNWAPWEMLFYGLCAEKEISLRSGGICEVTLPMRDRWRAIADDKEIVGAYSDAAGAIPGVGMNMTVAEILEDIYENHCGMPASSHNIVATPNNVPRNYNIYRTGGQRAAKTLCDHAGLSCYQRRSDAQIQVAEYYWGDDNPQYFLNTAEEITFIRQIQRAFDATSGEQLGFFNTHLAGGGFAATWPPHREPFYGRVPHADSVAAQGQAEIDARPLTAIRWWIRNRKLGALKITAKAQFWVEQDDQIGVYDNRFLGLTGQAHIVDAFRHSWRGNSVVETSIDAIYPHPSLTIRRNLRS